MFKCADSQYTACNLNKYDMHCFVFRVFGLISKCRYKDKFTATAQLPTQLRGFRWRGTFSLHMCFCVGTKRNDRKEIHLEIVRELVGLNQIKSKLFFLQQRHHDKQLFF